jgi:hypothetical protein
MRGSGITRVADITSDYVLDAGYRVPLGTLGRDNF